MVGTTIRIKKPQVSKNGDSKDGNGSGSGGSSFDNNQPLDRFRIKQIGLWLLLITITMFFASMTSALIIRRGSPDWKPIYFPTILWLNTALLILSSLSLEMSKKNLRNPAKRKTSRFWFGAGMVLGIAFLCGQVVAWRILAAHGLFLPTNPHSSFFYLLTGLHGIHLLSGLFWMMLLRPNFDRPIQSEECCGSMKLLCTYWHFLDFLWLYVFILLMVI